MEINFWNKIVLIGYICPSKICPKCGLNSLKLNDCNIIYNLIINRCSSYKYGKIVFLKDNSFYCLFPKKPISLIICIQKLWLIGEKNGVDMYKLVKDKYTNCSISQHHIYEILEKSRYIIAHFIKDKYTLEKIPGQGNKEAFAIDESNFVNITNRNLRVEREVNINTKKLRLEISFERNIEFMKKFIYAHIMPGNIIITDAWGAYNL